MQIARGEVVNEIYKEDWESYLLWEERMELLEAVWYSLDHTTRSIGYVIEASSMVDSPDDRPVLSRLITLVDFFWSSGNSVYRSVGNYKSNQ